MDPAVASGNEAAIGSLDSEVWRCADAASRSTAEFQVGGGCLRGRRRRRMGAPVRGFNGKDGGAVGVM